MNMQLDKAGISRGFSDAADTYDQWASAQKRIAEELARRIPGAPPRRQILDLGCGTGVLVDPLTKRFPAAALLGLDLAPGMIELCRRKWAGNPRVEFEQADAETFTCGRRFDLICASCVLQWFADPASAVRRWTDRLLSGGVFATAALVTGSFEELGQSYAHVVGRPMPGLWFPQPADIRRFFTSAGLSVVSAEAEQIRVHRPDARQVVRSFGQTGATFRHQADYAPLPTGVMRRLIHYYEQRFGDDDKGVPVTYEVLYLLAEAPS